MNEISRLIVSFFFLYKFIIFPIVVALGTLIELLTFKGTMKSAGEYLHEQKYGEEIKIQIVLPLTLVAGSAFLIYFNSIWGIIPLFIGLEQLIRARLSRKYSKVNGLYENGLIYRTEYLKWKKIHSWQPIDESTIIIHKQSGISFNYQPLYGLDKLLKKLTENNIRERIVS